MMKTCTTSSQGRSFFNNVATPTTTQIYTWTIEVKCKQFISKSSNPNSFKSVVYTIYNSTSIHAFGVFDT